MIQLQNVHIRRGSRELIKDANLQLHHGWHVGLTGNNGTGKSTLFSVLKGELSVDTGTLEVAPNWVVAHMAQEVVANGLSALDFVLSGDAEWFELSRILHEANSHLSDIELAELHSRFDDINGFTAPTRAAQMLAGLGFKQNDHVRAVSDFSGGWQMRLNLAKTLMCRSDLLLLDEPTNHLDLDAILWLEEWLSNYAGTLILISHDQAFLDNVSSHILHIENQSATLYTGNYTQFLRIRSERIAQHEQVIKQQEALRAHLQSYIDRFAAKATKAKQAQSRIKQLQRLQNLAPIEAERAFSFEFFEPGLIGSPLLELNDAVVGYDANLPIVSGVDIQITPESRIGLLGVNGSGKSTLIKSMVGGLPLLSGRLTQSDGLAIGYFSQHNTDALDDDATPLILLRRLAGHTSDAQLRAFLGSFGFSGERIDTQVRLFSGGERARLNLALIIWQKPNILILDEPTNHLDMQMKQSLILAVQKFTGAVVLVSHDRDMIRSVCDELYLVNETKCMPFDGDIDDYAEWLKQKRKMENVSSKNNQSGRAKNNHEATGASSTPSDINSAKNTPLSTTNNTPTLSKEEKRKQAAAQRKKTAPLRKEINNLETQLDKLTKELNDIEHQLNDTSLYDDTRKNELMTIMEAQGKLKQALEQTEELLLARMDELESLESSF